MRPSKAWYQSRTIWGGIGGVAVALSALFVGAAGVIGDAATLAEQLERLGSAGFALLAIYGRIKADKRIEGLG